MNKKNKFITRPSGIAMLACLCCLLWGSATPAIKIGYELFGIGTDDIASRILFAGVRFILAGILTVIFGSIISGKPLFPQKTSWGMICRLGLVQTVFQYIFFYMELAYTTGVKSAIINGSQTFIAILLACLVFRYEKLTLQKFLGCLIGFAGVYRLGLYIRTVTRIPGTDFFCCLFCVGYLAEVQSCRKSRCILLY